MKIKKDKKNIENQKTASPMVADHLRLPNHQLGAGRQFGWAVDSRRPIEFFIDGKKYHGFHGDTLAAALLANQQRFLAGSLLYHRPRGMFADKFYESNGFVAIGDNHHHGFEPAVAVATLPLSNGLKFYRTRHPDKFSSIQFFNKTKEALSALPAPITRPGHLSKNLGTKLAQAVGASHDDTPWRDSSHRSLGLMNSFTGKTFATTTSGFWTSFLRQMMGYAPAPLVNPSFQFMGKDKANQVFYDNHHHHHDVVVVGGGGSAAVALQSLLARLGKAPATIAVVSNEPESVTMAQMTAVVGKNVNSMRLDKRISWFFSTTAVMAKKLQPNAAQDNKKNNHDSNEAVVEILATQHLAKQAHYQAGECLWQERHHVFHCRAIVLATGKSEQLLPFDNNDLPGVMGFGNAVNSLMMHGVKPGHHAVVITNNDSIYHRLNYLHDAGVSVSAVIDIRKNIDPRLTAMAHGVGAMVYEFYYPKRARALYNQSTPTIFPKTIGKVIKVIGRVVRTDNPGVASLLAVQQLDENLSIVAPAMATKDVPASKPDKKKKIAEEIYVPARASKIVLARPDQTDEAMSAETEKIFNSDCLLVSGGFQPRLSLFTQLLPKDKSEGDYLSWSEQLQAYVPHHWPSQVFLVGAVGGCFDADDAANNKKSSKKPSDRPVVAMAKEVAAEVVNLLQGKKTGATPLPRHHHHHGFTIMPHRFLPDTQHLGRNSFIDHQYDVKLEHLHGSFAAGYHTPLGLKHYSKLGFGVDRGLGGLSLGLAHLYGNRPQQANNSGATTPPALQRGDNSVTMQNVIAHNNIFDELHGAAHPVAFGTLAHLPLNGRQFFNQTAIKGEMPLYPLTHRPKFFNVVMHPENNLNNDHGAHAPLQDGKKIPNYYPYHQGDDEETATLEEKQYLMSGIGFADGSSITTIKIVGKRAIDFLQFLSATKIANNKPGAAGGVTLLNPRDGLIIARGRYMVQAADEVVLTLPLVLPNMTEPGVDGQAASLLHHVARINKFSVGVIDDSEQWATLRLVGRGVALLASQFYNDQLLEKTFGKNFIMPKTFSKEEKEKLDSMARQRLIKNLPHHQVQELQWRGFSFLLTRRRFLPEYYIGGMVADIEITCPAHHAVALYQQLWQSALPDDQPMAIPLLGKKPAAQQPSAVPLAHVLAAMGYQPFGLGQLAMDYWRLLKGDGAHGAVGEIDGGHSLFDYRLNDHVRAGKFAGRDEGLKDALSQKNRPRLCGFITTVNNLDALSAPRHRGVIRGGSIVQELDKEPLAQEHGIGHITTAGYCPVRKKYIALGFVNAVIDPLSGKSKDPFGQEVMIADPLFKNYQRAIIVPHDQLALPDSKE